MTASPHALRLVRPAFADVPVSGPGAPVELDPDQAAAVAATGPGAPGARCARAPGRRRSRSRRWSRRSRAGCRPEDVLVLASGRRAAADLRDRLSARLRRTSGRPLVQTAAGGGVLGPARPGRRCSGSPPRRWSPAPSRTCSSATCSPGTPRARACRSRWPPEVRPDVLGLRPFRDELRDLLMRAAERGLTPVDLAALADRARPARVGQRRAAVRGVPRRRRSCATGTPDARRPARPGGRRRRGGRRRCWPGRTRCPGAARPRWRLVVVDDHQESTSATARLLRVLADDGARAAAAGGPGRGGADVPGRDAVAGRARGSATARDRASSVRARWCCGTVWRHDAGAAGRGRPDRGAGGCRRRGAAPARGRGRGPTAATSASPCCRAPRRRPRSSPTRCAARTSSGGVAVGRDGRRRAVGRPGDRAAARAGRRVGPGERARQRRPAARGAGGRGRCWTRCACASARCRSTPTTAARLACSPLGGLDAVGPAAGPAGAARRGARRRAAAGPATRCSSRRSASGRGRRPAAAARARSRGSRACSAAGRDAAARPGADAQTRPVGAVARRRAWPSRGAGRRSPGGAGGARADRDLDAVLALFRAAETFVDRMPQARAGRVRRLAAGAGPARRTRSRRAPGARRCRCSPRPVRPGREWDVVVVAGVQEGVVAGPAAAGLAARRAAARRPPRGAGGARRRRRRRVRGRRARRGPGRRAALVRRRVLACAPLAARDRRRRHRPPAVAVRRPGRPVRRRGRDPPAPASPRRSTCAGSSRSCGRTSSRPRVDGVEPDPAAARTLARLAAAGRHRGGPGAVVRPRRSRRATQPLWDADDARAGLAVQGRDRAALRAAVGARGRRRDGVGERRADPRHPRARHRAGAPARDRGGAVRGARPPLGASSGCGDGLAGAGDAGARPTRWCTGSPCTCATAGEPLLVEGAFARRHRPGVAARVGGPDRAACDDGDCRAGRARGRPQDRRQPAAA